MAYLALLMPLLLHSAAAPPPDAPPQSQPVQLASSHPATAPPLKSTPEKLICRRFQKTGTLAGFERVCRTKADWQRMSNDVQSNWHEIQGHKGAAWDGGP
jgi:hypothetical protein